MAFGAILGGAAGQVAGGLLGARAQDKAARAAAGAFAPSAEELSATRASFAAEERDIARRETELIQLSRAMTLAGGNLGDILAGKEASSLGPLRGQIERDRAQLRQRLRERLGSGFETSTAGSQALNEFDRQAELALTEAQQAQTGLLAGIAQGNRRGVIDPNFANLMNASLAGRSAAADVAAGQFRGDISRANILSNLGKSAFSAGTLSSIFGGGGGGEDLNLPLPEDANPGAFGLIGTTSQAFPGSPARSPGLSQTRRTQARTLASGL